MIDEFEFETQIISVPCYQVRSPDDAEVYGYAIKQSETNFQDPWLALTLNIAYFARFDTLLAAHCKEANEAIRTIIRIERDYKK